MMTICMLGLQWPAVVTVSWCCAPSPAPHWYSSLCSQSLARGGQKVREAYSLEGQHTEKPFK